MKGKKALEKLYFDNKDLKVDIALNDFKVCEIYNIIKQDLDRLEKIEKDLKQTKSNFKNSQTHSRNCYKKLLDRYMGLEKENQKLKERYKHRAETSNDLCEAVKQYEKAFKILQDKLTINILNYCECYLEFKSSTNTRTLVLITQEEYKLLKEVL